MARRNDGPATPADTRLAYSTGDVVPDASRARRGPDPPKPRSSTPATGGGKGIRVRLERRPGGRDMTTVLGVPGSAEAIAALARDLRAACGAGGTVRDGVIELQGDQCDKVRAMLGARGVKAR